MASNLDLARFPELLAANEERLASLKLKQQEFEAEEEYAQANALAQEILELSKAAEVLRAEQLKSLHTLEQQQLNDSSKEERTALRQKWEQRTAELQTSHELQLKQLQERHAELLRNAQAQLEQTLSPEFKPSTRLLNLICCKKKAVKAKKYLEAESLKHSIQQLSKREQAAHLAMRDAKIQQQLHHLRR